MPCLKDKRYVLVQSRLPHDGWGVYDRELDVTAFFGSGIHARSESGTATEALNRGRDREYYYWDNPTPVWDFVSGPRNLTATVPRG